MSRLTQESNSPTDSGVWALPPVEFGDEESSYRRILARLSETDDELDYVEFAADPQSE